MGISGGAHQSDKIAGSWRINGFQCRKQKTIIINNGHHQRRGGGRSTWHQAASSHVNHMTASHGIKQKK